MDNLQDRGIEKYGLGDIGDWASLVFPTVYPGNEPFTEAQLMGWEDHEPVPIGYVFIIERKFERPGKKAKWKLPAGHMKKESEETGWNFDRTPLDTAVHELESETGILLPRAAFAYAGKYLHWRGDHWKCLFSAKMTEADLARMNDYHPENEGETPKFFTVDEFYEAVRKGEFLTEHYEKLVEFGLILPLGRDQE